MAIDNPWTDEFWSLTAQGAYIKTYGLSVAQRTARKAGSSIGALKPRPVPPLVQQFILIKKIGSDSGATPPKGTSGTGPPT